MPANLCIINIQSAVNQDREEISFYESGEWSADSEKQLLARLLDIFSITRRFSTSLKLSVTIETEEMNEVLFLIKKKCGTSCAINNQPLSIREIEVLGFIMQGYTNNDIAKKLFISYETVKSHRKNILAKTGSKNTASLINYYHQTFFDK